MNAEILPTCETCARVLTLPSEIGAHECLSCTDLRADVRHEYQAERYADAMARWEAA